MIYSMFVFNSTSATAPYTLSLHDALPISAHRPGFVRHLVDRRPRRHRDRLTATPGVDRSRGGCRTGYRRRSRSGRSEEHTSELQSRRDFVCRLLLEKKKITALLVISSLPQ